MKKILSLLFLSLILFSCSKDEKLYDDEFQIYTRNETNYAVVISAMDDDANRLGSMQSNPESTNIGRFTGSNKVILYLKWYEIRNGQGVEFQTATASITNPTGIYNIVFAGKDYSLSK